VEVEDGGFLGGAVGPFEEDVSLGVVAEDAFGAEGTALDVSRKIAEGGFSAADGLKLDVPVDLRTEGAVLVGGEFLIDVGVLGFEGAMDEASKAGGEGLVVDEELIGLFGAMEGLVFGIKGDGGDDDVDVGMVLGLAAPGVKDGGEVELKVVVFELGAGDVVQGGGAAFEEEVVEDFGLMEAQGTELLRDGEGDHEVRDSQEFGFLLGGPLLLVARSALGAVPMVAGMVGVVFFVTSLTLIKAAAEFGRAAREDAPHGPVVVAG